MEGTPDASEVNETFGVFVATLGNSQGDGSREHPLGTVQAGIDHAKGVGKRVYVCSGTYREALELADSISVIGGADCSGPTWKLGGAKSRIEAPTSPAVHAKDITSPTRLEGLEIVAPGMTAPSTSSIGLIAEHANALSVVGSKVVAGDGAKGDDGTEGVQLIQSASADGGEQVRVEECVNGTTCMFLGGVGGFWRKPAGGIAGTNTCVGAPGLVTEAGGAGGSGGLWMPVNEVSTWTWHYYREQAANAPDLGVSRTGAPGRDGVDGSNAPPVGRFSADGYVPAEGSPGTDGTTGSGGSGGRGEKLLTDPNAPYVKTTSVWRGYGGSGGGAGGCPGLAGTQGKGGGASVAVLLIDSAVSIDASEILSGRGGDPGLGALGTLPTAGGAGGPSSAVSTLPLASGKPGGRGGAAGTSGNGSSGPSIGIAHVGAAPSVAGSTKIAPGTGGTAVAERTRTDALGVTKTVLATPAGLSKDILAL